jgi:tetratricopeptide (TPR) repeat protein
MQLYEQAIESFDEAEGLAPSDSNTLTQILYLRAKSYMKSNQLDKVLDGLKKVRDLKQDVLDMPTVFIDVGQIYANLGEESWAMECYHLALEGVTLSQTDQANVLYHRGCLLRDKKEPNFKSALADFRQASGLDAKVQPDLESNIFWMSGLLCIEQQNYPIGIEHLKKAIDSNPSKTHLPDIWISLGQAFFTVQNCKEAIKSYSKAINLGIEGEALAIAFFYRSKVYLSLKNFPMAVMDCEDALACVFENKELREEIQEYQRTLKKLS